MFSFETEILPKLMTDHEGKALFYAWAVIIVNQEWISFLVYLLTISINERDFVILEEIGD